MALLLETLCQLERRSFFHYMATSCFSGCRGRDWQTGYRANLWLRSAIRVLVQQAVQSDLGGRDIGQQLYSFFQTAADWPVLLPPGHTFSVEARVVGRPDISEQFLRLRARDAICDVICSHRYVSYLLWHQAASSSTGGAPGLPYIIREQLLVVADTSSVLQQYPLHWQHTVRQGSPAFTCLCRGEKPLPPTGLATLPLFIHVQTERIVLYRDMSGQSLHNRGYHTAMHRAALNEAAAAGILILAGWPQLASMAGQHSELSQPPQWA